MNFNHDAGSIDTILTIDTTTAPPLGGTANTLTITGTGALILPVGTTAQRPGLADKAWIRFNNETNVIEYHNGTVWSTVATTGGTISSVTVTTSTGMTVSGTSSQTITSNGTFALVLNDELQGIANLEDQGILVRTGAGIYEARTLLGTSGNIVVTNGDGSADPVINLASVAQGASGTSFVKVQIDGFGRIINNTPVTTADITTLVDNTYVNISGDTMTSGANLTFAGGGEVLGLPSTPSGATAAASKAYVDSVASGLDPKQSVRLATTTALPAVTAAGSGIGKTLTANAVGALTVDGISAAIGNRILVKNQVSNVDNGIYVVTNTGGPSANFILTRATDFDTTAEVTAGAFTFVEEGVQYDNTGWVVATNNPITVDTTGIDFVQFSGTGTYVAGNGLTLTGNQFSLTSPVVTGNGGTGLTTIGSANQVLGVNPSATGLEYKTVSAGTAISVTPSAGTLTIANTGVTSLSGTTNQITASASTGAVTLSLPSAVTTGSLTLTGLTPNSFLYSGTGGALTTSVAPTNGQLLIGSTGVAPVPATLSTGTGISVTNGAGTITIANTGVTSVAAGTGINVSGATGAVTISNTGVTSVNASGGTTGLTFTGGPVTTTGTLTLSGTLNITNGGTGLTTIGSANQVLGVNAAGSGAEYKTVAAGTGISITHGTGSITVANTGVTSVALSAPSIFNVTGSPVTTTGTLALALATQSANTVFAGPTSGGAATPTFRVLTYADSPIKLYAENPSSPTAPSATGTNAIAVGSGSAASATNAQGFGSGSSARVFGQQAFANGSFATAGDAQQGRYVYRGITTSNTPAEIFLDGSAQRLVLPLNSVFTFSIMIAARRTDATGGGAGYKIEGVIRKDGTAASTTLVGAISKSILGETNILWDVTVTADTTNGALAITVTGENSKTIRWVATALTTEVTN